MAKIITGVYDFLGNEFEAGQKVVFTLPGVRELEWGIIKKVIPMGATITYGKTGNYNCNRCHNDVIVLTEEQIVMLAQKKLSGI